MPAQELTLYVDARFVSPYAMSAFVVLHEKELPFGLKTLDLDKREHQAPGYSSAWLTRKVPTLVHGDFWLAESSAIAEYLEDAFPDSAPVFPGDVRARAQARQLQAWLRSDFMPIREERSTEVVFYAPSKMPLSDAARQAATRLFTAIDTLLAPGARHLFGDWCIADTDVAMMLNRLVMNGDQVPARLADYARSQWQRPSVQRWVNQQR